MPYNLVMPSMEGDSDDYVLHMDEKALIMLCSAVNDLLAAQVAEKFGDSK